MTERTGRPWRRAGGQSRTVRQVRRVVAGLATTLLVAGGTLVGAGDPAAAAACPAADPGVALVVDFASLGGGVRVGCAPGDPASGYAALHARGLLDGGHPARRAGLRLPDRRQARRRPGEVRAHATGQRVLVVLARQARWQLGLQPTRRDVVRPRAGHCGGLGVRIRLTAGDVAAATGRREPLRSRSDSGHRPDNGHPPSRATGRAGRRCARCRRERRQLDRHLIGGDRGTARRHGVERARRAGSRGPVTGFER